jgi:hypothetical protein
MKKILLVSILFIGFSFTSQSQTLKFSKVLLVSELETVPEGKVWKITSFLASGNYMASGSSGWAANDVSMKVNSNTRIIACSKTATYGIGLSSVSPFPVWLPENTTLQPFTNCGSLSVIEFSVID